MKLSAVIKWALVIVLLLAVAGGGALCWFWVNSDRLIHEAVEDSFRKTAPGWDIRMERTRFDGSNALHIYNVAIKDPTRNDWIIRIPELIATVDREEFARSQQLIIRSIRVRKPTIRVIRSADGTWNWQGLPPIKMQKKSLPEWTIEDAKFDVALNYGPNFPTANFSLSGGNAKLTPSSSRSFGFDGNLNIENAGQLAVKGKWDLDHRTWNIRGQMNEIMANDRLMNLVASASPEVKDRLDGLKRQVAMAATKLRGDPVRVASTEDMGLQLQSGDAPAFGIAGLLDIRFDVASDGTDATPQFRVRLGLQDGTVNNGALPFTLHNVDALLVRTNDLTQLLIKNAKNDKTQLDLEASVGTENGLPIGYVIARVKDLPLDNRVRSILPRSVRRLIDPLNVTGVISLTANLRAKDGKWIPNDSRLDIRNGTAMFDKFRYPIDAISGSIVQQAGTNMFDINIRGRAGSRQVTMSGKVRNPGPTAESLVVLEATSIPLDETFRAAWDEKGRNILDNLGIDGLADASVTIYREPKVGVKPIFDINASVRDGRLNYSGFPYALTQLTGNIQYSSKNREWVYTDLEAFHNDTKIVGQGEINSARFPERLHLELAARNATLTNDLRAAAGTGLQSVWDQLAPTGVFDINFNVDWLTTGGQPAMVSIPRMVLRNGSLKPVSFPYQLTNVNAALSYVPGTAEAPTTGQLTIERMTGKHANTTVDAGGWAKHQLNGDWQLHFNRLIAKNVVANADLLLALPESLRDTFQILNPTAPFGIENTELEFRGLGDPNVPITAAWHTETVLEGGAISAGMDLINVRGRVTNRGSYGPDGLLNEGEVSLSSAEVLDHKLTNIRGPYRIKDTQLWIGAPEVFKQTPHTVPVNKRITADAFGGQLTCDARVSLTDQSQYQVFATVANSDLRTYANVHMPAERNMSGKMNGWIHLHGAGPNENAIKGNGQLQISQAAIYEMPVMVNLLQALGTLNFAVADPVAFRYALLNFDVANRNFVFREIDLVGNAMSLRGRGRVDFDSRVDLDFYSKPPPGRGGILSQLVSGATSNWVHVTVDGELLNPKTRVQPNIGLDGGGLRPFLQTFDPTARPQIRSPFNAGGLR